MSDGQVQRRLAAILAADVVGYSKMMGTDEEGTLQRMIAVRKRIIDPRTAEYGGNVVKTTGDGYLIEFTSVVSAVHCATEFQRELGLYNEPLDPDEAIVMRIGVNIGDVMYTDDDIFGDGVNVAARLESIAPPGGICVSEDVYRQFRGKTKFGFVDGGEVSLKNISDPIHVWNIGEGGAEPISVAPSASAVEPEEPVERKPTLVLLPLEPLGGDEETKGLAATIDDEISAGLAKLTGISLVTEANEANYVAKGSVRAKGNRFRATLQLQDQGEQKQFWSERFDGDLEDIFDAMDELAVRICSALRYEVYERETEKSKQRPPEEQTNQQLMGLAGHILFQSRRADYEKSRELISVVIDRDPDNPMALGIGAWGRILLEVHCGYRPILADDGEMGMNYIRRSLELNERSDFAHMTQGRLYLHWERDTSAAILEAERSLELNTGYMLAMSLLGEAKSYSGQAEEGIALSTKAVETDARFPANHLFMEDIALGNFVLGDYDTAIDWVKRADQLQRDVPRILLMLTSASAQAGQANAAAEAARRLFGVCPDFRIADLRRWPFQNDADWQRFTQGLINTELPEC